ncbi:unnamed protein product [Mycena citricolor]|uniref:Uncharacterized protein n=1 Tax=Mycena citricolor TaxID=2018698 RepID=A0AAD2H8K4_9AGAR|nr:unnamed protein product [Mycena citricolor]CAK5269402.1 unnamed protein product [Mycena citricolor]
MVIQTTYIRRVRGQLEAEDEKKKKKRKGHLVGDGLPRVLTHPNFVCQVRHTNEVNKQKEAEKEQRKETQGEKDKAREEWKKQEEERRKENQALHDQWVEDCVAWERLREQMKAEGRKISTKKPLWKDRKLPNVPKPTILKMSRRKHMNQTASTAQRDSEEELSESTGSGADDNDFDVEDDEDKEEED